jgi:hypothetical protein
MGVIFVTLSVCHFDQREKSLLVSDVKRFLRPSCFLGKAFEMTALFGLYSLFADAAQGFAGNAQVRGDHLLGHALEDVGIGF